MITLMLAKSLVPLVEFIYLFLTSSDWFVCRAKLDKHDRLLDFVRKLESVCVETVESGKITKDLALLSHGPKSVFSLCIFLCSVFLFL